MKAKILAPLTAVVFILAACSERPAPEPPYPVQIVALRDSLARETEFWPGFDPSAAPVAIASNDSSWLFGHPSPPAEFAALENRPGAFVARGRRPFITANTSVELAGVQTVTLLIDSTDRDSLRGHAAVLIHEAFHIFEQERFPAWQADEGDLFLYPATDIDLLGARMLETESLVEACRALAGADTNETLRRAGHAALARARFDESAPEFAADYVRRSELYEGIARYVEQRARGVDAGRLFPGDPHFRADETRLRAYATGAAHAYLLDALMPAWKRNLAARATVSHETPSLAGLLAGAVKRYGALADTFPGELADEYRRRASVAVRSHKTRLASRLVRWRNADGYRIVIKASAAPLFATGFDPMNVTRLADNRLFHDRWLRLTNNRGRVEVMNQTVLTTPAGEHPIYHGVKRLEIAGLDMPPDVQQSRDTLRLEWQGNSIQLTGAAIEDSSGRIRIVLGNR
ncbi:MAG: hypothetical protein MAG453_00979 [Calditrichaeota bacterium]|nr:hypothetical protein [Calditrichota bacterium]